MTARTARIGTVATLLACIALLVAWELWLAPLRPGGSWLALKALPIAAAVPGVLRGRVYTYQWLSLLVWLYACEGVVRGMSDRVALSRTLGWIELVAMLALFAAAATAVRLTQRARAPG